MSYLYSPGNDTVDEIGKLNFIGDIVPHTWYKIIFRDNRKPYLNAIVILADIVYWYRPSEVREEDSGQLLGFKKSLRKIYYSEVTNKWRIDLECQNEKLPMLLFF